MNDERETKYRHRDSGEVIVVAREEAEGRYFAFRRNGDGIARKLRAKVLEGDTALEVEQALFAWEGADLPRSAPEETADEASEALFAPRQTTGQLLIIPVGQVRDSPLNPRQYFDPDKIADLAESIRQVGQLQPVVVRPVGDHYEVIAGARRMRAVRQLGLPVVEAVLKEMTDLQVVMAMMEENLKREDLSAMATARGFANMHERGMTQAEIGALYGLDNSRISNVMRLLKLPQEGQEILERALKQKHGEAALALPTADYQVLVLKLAAERDDPVSVLQQPVPYPLDAVKAGVVIQLGFNLPFPKCKGCKHCHKGPDGANYCLLPSCHAELKAAADKKRREQAQRLVATLPNKKVESYFPKDTDAPIEKKREVLAQTVVDRGVTVLDCKDYRTMHRIPEGCKGEECEFFSRQKEYNSEVGVCRKPSCYDKLTHSSSASAYTPPPKPDTTEQDARMWEECEVFLHTATADALAAPLIRQFLQASRVDALQVALQKQGLPWDAHLFCGSTRYTLVQERDRLIEDLGVLAALQLTLRLQKAHLANGGNGFSIYGVPSIDRRYNEHAGGQRWAEVQEDWEGKGKDTKKRDEVRATAGLPPVPQETDPTPAPERQCRGCGNALAPEGEDDVCADCWSQLREAAGETDEEEGDDVVPDEAAFGMDACPVCGCAIPADGSHVCE